MNPRLRVALRLPTIAFFLMTAWFGVLSAVPFAYLQFLRHQLFAWLEFFVVFHHFLYWGALLLAVLSIADDLAAGRRAAWAVVVGFGVYGLWLLWHPLLPTLVDNRRSLVVGVSALAVPIAFAVLDHLAAQGRVPWQRLSAPADVVLRQAIGVLVRTTAYLWLVFAIIAATRIYLAADQRLSPADYVMAVVWSLPLHLAAAAVVLVAFAAIFAGTRSPQLRFVLMMASLSGVGWLVVVRIVFPAIAFRGAVAAAVALVLASSAVFIWSGLMLRYAAESSHVRSEHSWRAAVVLGLLPILAFVSLAGIEKIGLVIPVAETCRRCDLDRSVRQHEKRGQTPFCETNGV